MEYYAFDENFNRIGILGNYISSTWREHYYKKGMFRLTADNTPGNARLIQPGRRFWQRGKRTSMIIEKIDDHNNVITAWGRSALNRLRDRAVNTAFYTSNVEESMYGMVNTFKRGLERLELAKPQGFEQMHESQITGGEVIDRLITLCETVDFGQYMRFDRTHDTYVVTRGEDKTGTVIFRKDFGNLQDVSRSDDDGERKNVAYVAGQGEGADRIIEIVGDYEGDERREIWVDARDLQQEQGETELQYRARLRARGKEVLSERIRVINYDAVPNATEYGFKYNLGDIVTVIDNGKTLNLPVMVYEEVIERNSVQPRVIFGKPKLTGVKS